VSDKDDQLKKMMNILGETRGKKITDFDTGILIEQFETLKGNPEEQYNEACKRLLHVYTRLKKLEIKDAEPILDEIEEFFEKAKLDTVSPSVDDYSEKEGRTIKITRSDDTSAKYSCTQEIFHETMRNIRMEQYFPLINKVQLLEAKAMAYLKDSIPWHNTDILEEIDPTMEIPEEEVKK